MELICLLCPSAISVYIYTKYYLKEKNKELIFNYYVFSVLINYLIMNFLLYNILNLKKDVSILEYKEKYILLSSIVAINIPILFNLLNNTTSKITKIYLDFIHKILDKFKYLFNKITNIKIYKQLTNYLKENKDNIKQSIIKRIIRKMRNLLKNLKMAENLIYLPSIDCSPTICA